GKPVAAEVVFAADEGPRADTSAEALSKLKPAYRRANGDGGERIADVRRRGRRGVDGGGARKGAGNQAGGPAAGLRSDGMPARGDGHRADNRDSQGAGQ